MSTRAERKARRNAARCRHCGQFGRHYAPPGAGSPGGYICSPPARTVWQCVCVADDAVRVCPGDNEVCWANGNGEPPDRASSVGNQ